MSPSEMRAVLRRYGPPLNVYLDCDCAEPLACEHLAPAACRLLDAFEAMRVPPRGCESEVAMVNLIGAWGRLALALAPGGTDPNGPDGYDEAPRDHRPVLRPKTHRGRIATLRRRWQSGLSLWHAADAWHRASQSDSVSAEPVLAGNQRVVGTRLRLSRQVTP